MPPVGTRKPISPRPDGAMGEWRDGAFHFDSPEAERQWTVDAYRNGVHADNWHLGTVLDDKTRDVVLSGIGGATAPVYRGPDGNYRFANRHTIEPADVRALRQQSFRGVTLRDLSGPAMPGEDVIAARFAASRAQMTMFRLPPMTMRCLSQLGRIGILRTGASAVSPPWPQRRRTPAIRHRRTRCRRSTTACACSPMA